jgi:tRNA A-37 threonylcarbamoyl transferase component Bud32
MILRVILAERVTLSSFERKSNLQIRLVAKLAGACLSSPLRHVLRHMHEVKDTLRATVRIGYDGRVHKSFRGPKAEERFSNEVRILRHLERQGCPFVPKLLEADPERLRIVTTSCGSRIEHLDEERTKELFAELERYGVRHDDPEKRNVTYRQSDGRFCLIDFEFATILPGFEEADDR